MAQDHDDNTNANNEVDADGGGAAKVEEVPSSPHPMETGAPEQQQGNGGGVGEATTTTTAAAAAAAAEGGGGLVQPTLFSYVANDLVWARAGTKGNEPFWPVRRHTPPLLLVF